MRRSESIKKVMQAIQNVQQNVPPLKREATGSTGNRSYKYTTLDKVWEAASAALKSEGLVVVQSPTTGESVGDFFETTIYHIESEQYITERMLMKISKDDPQGIGSAITYYRRYMLVSMLGLIVQGDDTDASEHKLATAAQKAKIIGATKIVFPEINDQATLISTIQNIVGKHPSYIREDEADDAVKLIQAFTKNQFKEEN